MFSDATAVLNAYYGQGNGSIHLNAVQCSGTETNILECVHDSITTDCGHVEDAGVECETMSK